MDDIPILISFAAGLLSFLSPCVLPLVPGFLALLSAINSSNQIKDSNKKSRWQLFINSVFFVGGFVLGFSILGFILSSLLGSSSYEIRSWVSRIGGIIIILFGLFILGKIKIPFLQKEYKLKPLSSKYQFITSAIFGVTFAMGWSPCIGAVLGSILTLAAVNPATALPALLAYSLGLGVPFLLIGIFGSDAIYLLRKFRFILPHFNTITGILLIILGILVFTQSLISFSNLISPSYLANILGFAN